MPTALVLALVLTGQSSLKPDYSPMALHRGMEIDDLEREVQRQHDTVLLKRGQLASTQRLAKRELVPRAQLERDSAALRFEEAHEIEMLAYRDLKVYERDAMDRTVVLDESKYYSLLLDWLKKQESMSRVDLEYADFLLRQSRNLQQRKAVSRQEVEEAELNVNRAQASVALSLSRQAQVGLEQATRGQNKPDDRAKLDRLKVECLKASVQYYEIILGGYRSRLAFATERSRRGLLPQSELVLFQKATESAEATLDAERQKLEKLESKAADTRKAP